MTPRVAIALMMLLGCERADHADVPFALDDSEPAVGDASTVELRMTMRLVAPDGSEHVDNRDLTFSTTCIEVRGGVTSVERLVIDRDVHTKDHAVLPAMVGSYLVRATDTGHVGTREDGRPLTTQEESYFTYLPRPLTPAERATLHGRVFHTGERFEPTAVERRMLGLGADDDRRRVEVHVVHADARGMTIKVTFEELAKSAVVGKGEVRETVTHTALEQTIDVTWFAGDQQIATSHMDAHLTFHPAATTTPR